MLSGQGRSRYQLRSSFAARIVLRATLPSIEHRMRSNPILRQTSYGTLLRYSVADIGAKGGKLPILEICKSRIVYSFTYLNDPARREYLSNLLKFLSLLAYAGDTIVLDMGSIYPYIIDSLSDTVSLPGNRACSGSCNFKWVESRMRSVGKTNLYLSDLSLSLISLKGSAEERASRYQRLYCELLYAISVDKSASGALRSLESMGLDSARHSDEVERLFSGRAAAVSQ